MISPADRQRAADILAQFEAAGAVRVEASVLQPAGALLDLYGEDIRARAFTTTDPLRGETMLRPDFTVPVVQAHMADGAEPARYAYLGEVFRKQEADPTRAREYLQVGFEVFDGSAPADADAEVFAALATALTPYGADPHTGDLGILIDAVDGLSTSQRRRAALRRHIWRPRRFRRLLDRYAAKSAPPANRRTLLTQLAETSPAALLDSAGQAVGLRGADEITERLEALIEDAETPPIPGAEADVLEAILTMDTTLGGAMSPLQDLAVDLPALGPAIDRLEARADALAQRGIDPGSLPFAPTRGRSAMEYYDGFVFTFTATGRSSLPPLATGGRYDALTAVLGQGRSIPAVGGVIRPGLLEGLA